MPQRPHAKDRAGPPQVPVVRQSGRAKVVVQAIPAEAGMAKLVALEE
jgi:hypothetical protein